MSHRWASRQALGRTDANQKGIVEALRKLPGISVQTGHDDLLIGYNLQNYWFEIKKPESLSKRNGKVRQSAKKTSQQKLEKTWTGQYNIVTSVEEIIDLIGYGRRR